jgi:hypothetical protein
VQSGCFLALLTNILPTQVLADPPHFGKLMLSPGFQAEKETISGYTGGSYSLSTISNRDRNNKACIGFADPTPDAILVLQKDFSHFRIQVHTSGSDTTLLVKGPDDVIRCGDDTGNNKDASVEDTTWKAGSYRVWVGTFNSGERRNYTLSVQE